MSGQPPAKVARIGYISASSSPSSPLVAAFQQGLRDLGYLEGQNLVIEYRFAEKAEQLPDMAADLVHLNVDVVVAAGTLGIRAAGDATKRVPIVMANSDDAVRSGLVASLARPGGNITGLTRSPEPGNGWICSRRSCRSSPF